MREPFDRAVTQHGPTVLRVCRAVLGRGPDADDAWVDTFIALLRRWPDLPEDTNIEAYLVRAARHQCVDIIRTRQRQPAPTADLPDRPSALGNPGEHDIWEEVAALPERQRLALAYHFLGGLTHRETAELIGGSADAVRRAAADGIARLRRTV